MPEIAKYFAKCSKPTFIFKPLAVNQISLTSYYLSSQLEQKILSIWCI